MMTFGLGFVGFVLCMLAILPFRTVETTRETDIALLLMTFVGIPMVAVIVGSALQRKFDWQSPIAALAGASSSVGIYVMTLLGYFGY